MECETISIHRLLDERVKLDLKGKTKEEILRELLEEISKTEKLKSIDEILKTLLEREKLASTGVGRGVAIPHIRTQLVSHPMLVAGLARDGVDFNSADGCPAKLFFLFLAPQNNCEYTVSFLSMLSRILSESKILEELEFAKTPGEFKEIIKNAEEKLY